MLPKAYTPRCLIFSYGTKVVAPFHQHSKTVMKPYPQQQAQLISLVANPRTLPIREKTALHRARPTRLPLPLIRLAL